ncbi:hypothetical protein SAMN04489727_1721 [Amycolatopsis tolypomycina]|uniref:Uncharacterized protein n=1 Tax=Amycolatopsis tolypomycina TaxID=208445 RepID=A0A1H4JBT6_9PSEU|nr:DUF6582 domain-containing protein [Amycolatopsis tolypomycina]SEB43525.1 hypothetical protein SAMN04489727_1721 [Amycolatopsis tolypomycina]
MNEHPPPVCSDPGCGACAQARATAAFRGEPINEEGAAVKSVTCPQCQHVFVPGQPERVTEATAAPAKATGDVEYADPGWQKDGKKRYPLDTTRRVKAAWSYINDPDNAAPYKAKQLQQIKAKIKAAAKKLGIEISDKAAEAWISGTMSFTDLQERVRAAVRARVSADSDDGFYRWVWIADMSAAEVVYSIEGPSGSECALFQCTYTVNGTEVELGEPAEVVRTYAPATSVDGGAEDDDAAQGAATAVTESVPGRLLEAKGTDAAGNRIFRIRVINTGDSRNGTRYPQSVLEAAAPLYDGAKVYDHHRTEEELRTSTTAGLIGYCRAPEAVDGGIDSDLYLLPSAKAAAEALDASLALQAEGLAPLVGFSHDVVGYFKSVTEGATRVREATSIEKVNSADLVADPAAGGHATRMVAGGITNDPAGTVPAGESTKESTVGTTTADVLAALKDATPEMLSAVGLRKADTTTQTEAATTAAAGTEQATEAVEAQPKSSFLGKLLIRQKVADAFPATMVDQVVESVTGTLPDRITESAVDGAIASIKSAAAIFERADLAPSHSVEVTQESRQKKIDALDAFFAGDTQKGYRSFREAFVDFTGARPRAFDEEFARTILRESFGGMNGGYDSAVRRTESMDSTTWNLVLGDSITRRMVAEYAQPSLQTWRAIVSIMTVNDFRTQRIERIGGYGVLPTVAQGAPYQPLTSPTNEEANYAVTKRGGTEDVTLEMIANDDIRAIQRIPSKLGLAAAQTLYRFVWDFFVNNAATSYDAVALFHATHANTDANALSQTNLSVGRRKMRKQAAYGDSSNVLSIVPKTLIVPSDLEELAFQLCTSAVAIPATPAGPTDTPNIHQGLQPIVIDYWTSATGWFLSADPNMVPTIEIGFYNGKQDPELFTQADQTVGSMFNADKLTYKVRHIYSGAVLDHRGLYRGNS